MSDLFKRTEVDFGGAMTSEKGLIVPNKGLTGLLMQNIALQYVQQVSRLYEVGRSGENIHVYYIGGRAQGTLSPSHIIGPGPTMRVFYDNFGDVCEAATNDIQIKLTPNICPGTTSSEGLDYTAKFCVLTMIGFSVQSEQFVINEGSQLMFSALQTNAAGGGTGGDFGDDGTFGNEEDGGL